ncbi:transcriptional regulator Crp/Fnr family [Clostridium aceticum]|uniref:Transcriptional regulator Crp/Fnr family n=2 Tax=Clostridium aceticum TaxID=84022 RepID=A0A0G3WA49_9CLOT|nr:Crp/Fnr family transcriptional regulator [Clostridium aceticum]AKL94750.1 transcriptional regulator Crp/Fnr family [Clostridium aceticum]
MKDLELFQSLSPEEKHEIMKLAHGKTYLKGEMVFFEGDPADTIYLIKSGIVLLYKVSEKGKEVSLGILQENDIFGENTIFDDIQHTMNAKALENTFVCTCNKKDLPELLKDPMISLKIIKLLGDKLNNYTEQMATLAFQDVKGRVLDVLIRLAREYGEMTPEGIRINLLLNHQDLANLVNASRVMVTNTINELKREGVIRVNKRFFFILNSSLIKKNFYVENV